MSLSFGEKDTTPRFRRYGLGFEGLWGRNSRIKIAVVMVKIPSTVCVLVVR